MISRRTFPVLIGIVLLSAMFLTGQDKSCTTPAECDDGNPCTDDECVGSWGSCVHTNATEVCDNAVDDDCDGFIDTADPDCPVATGPVPDTGITKCYNTTSEITCPSPGQPFYGQDAQYVTNPMSYGDNGNGTVTDNVTGLMWQKCSAGLSGAGCSTGSAATYTWANAITYCENLVLPEGGYTDWRLPNQYELQSIVDYGHYEPAIDTAAFPGTISQHYWSSSTYAGYPYTAWYVSYYTGYVYGHYKFLTYYVRCVR